MRISDWSSDVCSSDLRQRIREAQLDAPVEAQHLGLAGRREAVEGVEVAERRRDGEAEVGRIGLRLGNRGVGGRHALDRQRQGIGDEADRKSTTSELQSLMRISYAVFCLKKKNKSTVETHAIYSAAIHTTTRNKTTVFTATLKT